MGDNPSPSEQSLFALDADLAREVVPEELVREDAERLVLGRVGPSLTWGDSNWKREADDPRRSLHGGGAGRCRTANQELLT